MEKGKRDIFGPLRRLTRSYLRASGLTAEQAPLLRAGSDLRRIMLVVVLALLPCVLMAMWNTGYQIHAAMAAEEVAALSGWRGDAFALTGISHDPGSQAANLLLGALHFLPILLFAAVAGLLWEALFAGVRGIEMSEGWGVVALMLALSLPPAIPLWQVALGASFGTVFGKEIFGGTGRNFLNPALTGYAFLFFAYPNQFSGASVYVPVDGVTEATPLAIGAEGGIEAIRESLTFGQALLGTIPGSMGETSALACLFGAAVLLATGVASWRTMGAVLIGAVGIAGVFYAAGSVTNPMFSVPPHWHLVLGSLAFGLVFMSTDPVSSALTPAGKWFYGLLVGALIILVRVVNPAFPEGTMLGILLGNVFAPVIDRFVIKAHRRKRRRALRYGQ